MYKLDYFKSNMTANKCLKSDLRPLSLFVQKNANNPSRLGGGYVAIGLFIKLLIILIYVLSANAFAGEIYKCIDGNGKQSFSDMPCENGLETEKLTYKERTWITEVKARKPVNTTILSVRKDDIATEFEYQFSIMKELKKFIRLAGEISGKNVYLLKIIEATNVKRGFALIKVTSKGNNLFLKKKP